MEKKVARYLFFTAAQQLVCMEPAWHKNQFNVSYAWMILECINTYQTGQVPGGFCILRKICEHVNKICHS